MKAKESWIFPHSGSRGARALGITDKLQQVCRLFVNKKDRNNELAFVSIFKIVVLEY